MRYARYFSGGDFLDNCSRRIILRASSCRRVGRLGVQPLLRAARLRASFGARALLLTLTLALFSATSAFAVANVTAGSASASADTAADATATTPGFATVSTITIAESANNTFSQNNTTYTLTFIAPSGWTFDLGGAAPSVTKNGGGSDINTPTINRVRSSGAHRLGNRKP
jgi:hypothetical protein